MIKAVEGERKRVAGEWESISQVRPFMRIGLLLLQGFNLGTIKYVSTFSVIFDTPLTHVSNCQHLPNLAPPPLSCIFLKGSWLSKKFLYQVLVVLPDYSWQLQSGQCKNIAWSCCVIRLHLLQCQVNTRMQEQSKLQFCTGITILHL